MKKFTIIVFALLLVISLTVSNPIIAATDDFTADGNITVTGVTFGTPATVDMLILDGSTSESWTFSSGTFTVVNPGSAFKIGSSNNNVNSIKATRGGSDVACAENTTKGTSYLTLPTTAGTYTITPLTTTDCTTLCTTLSNVATYNNFPTCGAATCNSGYSVSGSGASATCAANSSGGGTVSTTYCSSVEYDEWQDACINNWQYRNVLSRSPINCSLTTAQENERKRECGAEDQTTLPEIIEEIKDEITEIQDDDEFAQKIIAIASDAAEIVKANVNALLGKLGFKRDLAKEEVSVKKYVRALIKDAAGLPEQSRHALTNFITYGTNTTLGLGEGERAGVVNSYKSAFENLPTTEEDWNDVIKIANGRWPGKQNAEAEEKATLNFKIVYLREPDRSNPNDDAAVTVMAYGLRPADRNLNSEKAGIRIFKDIYGYNPEKATAWDVVRAIAYSGATR